MGSAATASTDQSISLGLGHPAVRTVDDGDDDDETMGTGTVVVAGPPFKDSTGDVHRAPSLAREPGPSQLSFVLGYFHSPGATSSGAAGGALTPTPSSGRS